MIFKIHCNEDHIVIEGDTIEEIREVAFAETARRGWNENDCWSERISD